MMGIRSWAPPTVTVLATLLLITACSDDAHEPAPAPQTVGSHVSTSGCLDLDKQDDPPTCLRDRGYLGWSYDADTGTLRLNHLNAALNCCPEFTAAVSVAGDTLRIVETETSAMCDCLCLYNIGFEVAHLPAGVYHVVVEEEHLQAEDPPLAGTIDLAQTGSGALEAVRGHYPWAESPAPAGRLVEQSGCLAKAEDEDPPPIPRDRGFLFWSYDAATRTLAIDHVNAGLNCCPEFTATLAVAEGALTIVEDETVAGCHCVCLFRLGFEVSDLPVGVYEVTVREEHLQPDDPPLAGVIDLTQAEFGTIQAPRCCAPWEAGD